MQSEWTFLGSGAGASEPGPMLLEPSAGEGAGRAFYNLVARGGGHRYLIWSLLTGVR